MGKLYYNLNDCNEAIPYLQKTVEIKPNKYDANFWLGKLYFQTNESKPSEIYLQKCIELQKEKPGILSAYTYAYLGNSNRAIELLKSITNADNKDNLHYIDFANVFSILKKDSQAIDYIPKSLEAGCQDLLYITSEPNFDRIRNLNEFKSLIDKYHN